MADRNSDWRLALELDVTARIQRVCEGWPQTVFAALVKHIVMISAKYDYGAKADLHYERCVTEVMDVDAAVLADRSADMLQQTASQSAPQLEA